MICNGIYTIINNSNKPFCKCYPKDNTHLVHTMYYFYNTLLTSHMKLVTATSAKMKFITSSCTCI